jgi:hypothetical protein
MFLQSPVIAVDNSYRVNFLLMPSPRAAYQIGQVTAFDLPTDAVCYPNDASMARWGRTCARQFTIGGDVFRRLRALDYIRDNFCMGQPEPPPPPRQAY